MLQINMTEAQAKAWIKLNLGKKVTLSDGRKGTLGLAKNSSSTNPSVIIRDSARKVIARPGYLWAACYFSQTSNKPEKAKKVTDSCSMTKAPAPLKESWGYVK